MKITILQEFLHVWQELFLLQQQAARQVPPESPILNFYAHELLPDNGWRSHQ